jgi:hypothetical protein
MKTERIVTLVSPEQAKQFAARAKAMKVSVGEFSRQAMESFATDEEAAEFAALCKELHETVKRLKKRFPVSEREREQYLNERAHGV